MAQDMREAVRERYGAIASQSASCCGGASSTMSSQLGYSPEDLGSVPQGADLGLGCGNPVALAALKEGDTVLDLGSGAGFDCFLAARRVGESGKVIGVDMTPQMLAKARDNAEKGGYNNVEFRRGEIESLPVDDASVDVVISNCVINLSPEKDKVFAEAYRVLKPGGRAFISDLVLLEELPASLRENAMVYSACIGGAILKDAYLGAARNAGFTEHNILGETAYPVSFLKNDPVFAEAFGNLSPEAIDAAVNSVVSIKLELAKAS